MTTPQEAFDTLIKELSASGSTPIIGPDGTKKTLREAISDIYWKQTFLLPLTDRPRSPNQTDDHCGQLLSMRAEQLMTQALVAEMCTRFGINVQKIFDAAKASFKT